MTRHDDDRMERVTVSLEPDVYALLRKLADQEDRTMSGYVRRLIQDDVVRRSP